MRKLEYFQKIVLDNGVVLIVVPMDTKKTGIQVFINNGSQYEKKNESGLSHFVEHYLFRGTKKMPDFRAIEERLQSITADPHAHTDFEEVCYGIRAPFRHFLTALEVISEVLINPTFRPDEIRVEKDVIVQEMGTCWDRLAANVQCDLWSQVCYGDQPAGRPVIGTEETVKSFTAETLERWFKKHYVGEAMKVAVAGGEDVEQFIPQLKEVFGRVRPGRAQKSIPPQDNQKKPRHIISYKEASLTHLYLGAKTPFRSSDEGGYAAMILAGLINRSLYFSMIGDRGLSYERCAEYIEDPTKSYLAVYAGVSHERLEETIRLILAEFRKVRDIGVTKKDLDNEIEAIVETLKESFEDEPMAVTTFFGRDALYRGEVHSLAEEIKRTKQVSRSDIQERARAIFLPKNLNLAVLGPYKDGKQVMNIFNDF